MGNNIEIFKNEQFGEIRVVEIDSEPWFVAADVCKALEIKNSRDALGRLDDDEKGVVSTDTLGGIQEMSTVNEPGLYSLVLGSRKPEAKEFKRWITHDVIPTIRKTGGYVANDDLFLNTYIPYADEETKAAFRMTLSMIRVANAEKAKLQQTVAVQGQQIAEMQPKVSYYEIVLQCKDLLPISTIAKDYGWSGKRMNQFLHEKGVQYKQGKIWLLYQKYAEMGYTSTKTNMYVDNNGEEHMKVSTYWTQKGRLFLYDLLKSDGILPLIEQGENVA